MILKGKIKTGLGTAKFWVSKIEKIFEKKFGIKLFLGTLNIELNKPYILKTSKLIIKKEEYDGNQDLLIEKCNILNEKAFILRAKKNQTKKGDHPLTIIEIISNINLREKYNLLDDDEIEIEI